MDTNGKIFNSNNLVYNQLRFPYSGLFPKYESQSSLASKFVYSISALLPTAFPYYLTSLSMASMPDTAHSQTEEFMTGKSSS